MRARSNRSSKFGLDIDQDLLGGKLSDREIEQGYDHYQKWHWSIPPTKVIDWNDPELPRTLVECGRLARLHIRLPKGTGRRHPRLERDSMIQLSEQAAASSYVAYDPNQSNQRLYFLLDAAATNGVKKRLWDANNVPAQRLQAMAKLAGGRHSRQNDYPDILVKPVGVVSAIVYFTEKEGDPAGPYLHKMGEVSEYYPFLCADAKGRLWLAGGGYRAPFAGIED